MIEAVLATENSLQASEMSLLSVFLAKIEFTSSTTQTGSTNPTGSTRHTGSSIFTNYDSVSLSGTTSQTGLVAPVLLALLAMNPPLL